MSDMVLWDKDKNITKANYQNAAKVAQEIKIRMAHIEYIFSKVVKAAHQSHKISKAAMDDQLKYLNEAEIILKSKFEEFHKKNIDVKIDGVSFVEDVKVEIINETKIPDKFMMKVPDIKSIKDQAKKDGSLFKCPGVKIIPTYQVKIRKC